MQVDHTIPHDQGGESGIGNYGPDDHHPPPDQDPRPAGRSSNPSPGIYVWRDPHGGFYLVDHTGTRQLHGNEDQDGPGHLMIAEFWHSPPMKIDWAA